MSGIDVLNSIFIKKTIHPLDYSKFICDKNNRRLIYDELLKIYWDWNPNIENIILILFLINDTKCSHDDTFELLLEIINNNERVRYCLKTNDILCEYLPIILSKIYDNKYLPYIFKFLTNFDNDICLRSSLIETIGIVLNKKLVKDNSKIKQLLIDLFDEYMILSQHIIYEYDEQLPLSILILLMISHYDTDSIATSKHMESIRETIEHGGLSYGFIGTYDDIHKRYLDDNFDHTFPDHKISIFDYIRV